MECYKVILVDDEEDIRQGIIRRIRWEELGFVVIGQAENGIEALEMIEKTSPDLVISDIKMPFMDGIQLATEIHERFPAIKMIILSGFDDFEYAQEALKLGVLRYILKPINALEMCTLLREIKVILDEEILSKRNLNDLRCIYKKTLPLLKERFLNQWIEEEIPLEFIKENIMELGLKLYQDPLVIIIIRPDEIYKRKIINSSIGNKHLLKLAIFNICEEISLQNDFGMLFERKEEFIVIAELRKNEQPKSSSYLFKKLEQMRIMINKYLHTTITIGVGSLCTDYTLLYKSYLGARSALDYTITVGNNKIIYIDDIEPSHSHEHWIEEVYEHTLITLIKLGQEKKIGQAVDKILNRLEGECLALREYQIYILGILSTIMKLGHNMKLDMNIFFPKDTNLLEVLSRFYTKDQVQNWLTQICISMAQDINKKHKKNKNELVHKAIEHIMTHYSDEELNAEQLCQHLHVSPNYFSALFKKEMGITFSTYLTQVRIEKAKELLKTTNIKASEIGHAVGYSEGHYFSYVFKKVTGCAPTDYRNGKISSY